MQALRAARARWVALRQARRALAERRPALGWTLAVLSWLPLGLFVAQNVFNVKTVRGQSMQVRRARLRRRAGAREGRADGSGCRAS